MITMYLKGSKWSMNRRRKPTNWFLIIVLSLLIVIGFYINKVVLPDVQPIGVPTKTPTRAPESYISEAEQLFNDGKLLQAIESYQKAVSANPNDPTTYISLARVQVFAGQYKDAQVNAENALLLNADNSMAHAVRGWALDFQGEYLTAEAAVKKALEIDPNNGLAHAYYAEIMVDAYLSGTGPLDSIEKASEQSRLALDLAPNTLEAHRARGYVLEVTANYEEAIREYQAAITLNDNIPDLHLALGRNYRALGVYDKAVEEFTRANTLNPPDPQPDLLIARTYATVGEYKKAVQFAEQALKDSPADARLHGTLGVMYYKDLRWPDAIEHLALAIKGGRTDEGQVVNGLELISTDTRIIEYYYTYGLALARSQRCGEALPVAQALQATVPGDEIAVANAEEITRICEQNLLITPTPDIETVATQPPVGTVTPTP